MKKTVLIYLLCLMFPWNRGYAQEKASLRIGYVPLLTQLPLVISYENNRLDLREIDLKLIKYTTFTTIEAALRVGAIDAASIPVPVALGIAADAYDCEECQIAILGAIHRGGTVLVAKEQGGLESIQGKLIGVPGLDSAENLLLKDILTAVGLRVGLDYRTLDIPFEMAIKQLTTGKLDALYLPEPYGTFAERERVAMSVNGQKNLLTGTLTTLLVIRSELLTSQTSAVKEWLISVMKSCQMIEDDIKHAGGRQTAISQTAYFGYSQDIVATSLVQRKGDLRFKYVFPDIEELQQFMQWASEMKLIMRSIDWDTLIAYDFVKQVESELK